MKKYTYIYSLNDPITHQVRYIGKTDNTKLRLSNHLAEKNKTHKVNWIKSLKNKGLKPYLIIVDKVKKTEWQFWEQHYISLYKSWGFNLTNGTLGGEGNNNIDLYALRKKVCCYKITGELLKCYDSISSAAKLNNLKIGHISSCCKGNLNTCGNYVWRYKEDSFIKHNSKNKKARIILQYDLQNKFIKEYCSISQAAKELKCVPTAISRVLAGKRTHFRKYIFKYKDIV